MSRFSQFVHDPRSVLDGCWWSGNDINESSDSNNRNAGEDNVDENLIGNMESDIKNVAERVSKLEPEIQTLKERTAPWSGLRNTLTGGLILAFIGAMISCLSYLNSLSVDSAKLSTGQINQNTSFESFKTETKQDLKDIRVTQNQEAVSISELKSQQADIKVLLAEQTNLLRKMSATK